MATTSSKSKMASPKRQKPKKINTNPAGSTTIISNTCKNINSSGYIPQQTAMIDTGLLATFTPTSPRVVEKASNLHQFSDIWSRECSLKDVQHKARSAATVSASTLEEESFGGRSTWSPWMDGIVPVEADFADSFIDAVLYGPRRIRSLGVGVLEYLHRE